MFDFEASAAAWDVACTTCREWCVAAYNRSSDALFNSAEDMCAAAAVTDWTVCREWRAIRQSLTWEAQPGIEKFD